MSRVAFLAVALTLGAGCSTTKSGTDGGLPDSGTVDSGQPPVLSNSVVGDAGFEVLSSDSAFGELPDGGADPTQLAGFLFDHPGRCGGSNKPTDAGVYDSVGFYLSTADLPSIPLGTYQCGDNVPLGGGHVSLTMTYLVEQVVSGVYEGVGLDFKPCSVTLTQVGSNARMQGSFQGDFAWPDGGKNALSGTFDTSPCPPGNG